MNLPAGERIEFDKFAELQRRDEHLPYLLFSEAEPIFSNTWLIKHVLPRQGLAVIYGPPGEGKTFVCLDMLLSLARGADWREHRTQRTAVLYLAPDGGAIVNNRLAAYRQHHDIEDADFVLVPCAVDLLGKVNAGDIERVADLIKHLEALHDLSIGIVCVDTVSRAMPSGDENQAVDMTHFIANLATLQNGSERLILGVHHTPKSDAATLRGHSSLHGAADCEINVNERCIKIVKQRDGPDGTEFGFNLHVVELGDDVDGDPVTSCVVVEARVNGRPEDAARQLKGAVKKAFNLLQREIEDCGEIPPTNRRIPEHLRCVRLEAWKTVCSQEILTSANKSDAKRMAFKRAFDRLQDLGLIGYCEPWVWTTNT